MGRTIFWKLSYKLWVFLGVAVCVFRQVEITKKMGEGSFAYRALFLQCTNCQQKRWLWFSEVLKLPEALLVS